jgi:D-cysteine desulfhydrase
MHLARIPRRRYTPSFTPIEKLAQLTKYLDGPDIYVKRDDLLGLAAGGNKTRKLEFLMADALEQEADTLVTVGAVQSNHCRLTLAAAIKEGLKCRLVLEERVPGSYREDASGNNFLYRLLGAESITVVKGGTDLSAAMQSISDELAAQGRKAYVIPGGGSNALGALGYAACAEEILAQSFDSGLAIDHVVCASGSGGTHAGLALGLWGNSSNVPVTGISVRAAKEPQEEKLHALANASAALLGVKNDIPREAFTVFDDYVGPGYSLPTEGMLEAVRLLAHLEGLLLDPVYTGKAMAGLIDLVRKGHFRKGENVLFVHTGGSPALYAYQETLLEHQNE